jgi:phosphate transport system protein
MERRIEEELGHLKAQLLDMAARVERNVGDAVAALRDRDPRALQSVIDGDIEVDLMELQIDERCVSLLALQQPVARDLRFVATTLKIVKDIERVGDIAKNIAKHGLAMVQERPVPFPDDLLHMVRAAQDLLKNALDAFVTQDATLARQVIQDDDRVDKYHKKNVQHFIELMIGDATTIGTMTQYLSVNKFIERFGDHSTNIAAMVVYMVEGRDIRHLKKQLAHWPQPEDE